MTSAFGLRAVLADLDDTLFDHRGATRDALSALRTADPAFACWTLAEFDARHRVILEELHLDVLDGRRTIDDARRARFARLLRDAGAGPADDRIGAVADVYRVAYANAWRPIAGAAALAAAIRGAGLSLVIVTNNLVAEQRRKLSHCRLDRHVSTLVTSEEVGVPKPRPEIFREALRLAGPGGIEASDAVMFGDAWGTDITGARAAGIRAVWFNPERLPSPDPGVAEVASLEPVNDVLRVLIGV